MAGRAIWFAFQVCLAESQHCHRATSKWSSGHSQTDLCDRFGDIAASVCGHAAYHIAVHDWFGSRVRSLLSCAVVLLPRWRC